jgi:hypothetical protein
MPWIAPAVGAVAAVIGAANSSKAASAPVQSAQPSAWVDPKQYATNLSDVQGSLSGQKDLATQLREQNALQNQTNIYNQLQGVVAGTGPNPAQAMLANQTGANIAAQNALMASQRGAGANPALIARQAAMQGANLQQQATGQAAALQAQQSLGALGTAGQLANTQASQLLQGTNQYTNAALQGQSNLLNAKNAQDANAIANATQINKNAQENQGRQAQLAGNVNNAVGTAIAGPLGTALTNALTPAAQPPPDPMAGTPVEQQPSYNENYVPTDTTAPTEIAPAGSSVAFANGGPVSYAGRLHHQVKMAKGGPVPAMVSPGEKYLPPAAVNAVKQGANPMAVGKTVPGKPKVSGNKNSYKNDTVPATLQEGGIVLPRSVTQAKDPAKKAHEFVAAIMKQRALKRKR